MYVGWGRNMSEERRRERNSAMEKVVTRISKALADEAEISYWVNKTSEERLAALAMLRQRHENIFPKGIVRRAIRKRLRRVHRRKQSQVNRNP